MAGTAFGKSKLWTESFGFVIALILLAVATFLTFRALNPGWVAYRHAVQAVARGDEIAATRLFDRAVRFGVPASDAELHLGRLHMQAGSFAKAEAALRNVIANHPADLEAAKMLAGIHQQRGATASAIHVYLDAKDAGATLDPTARLHLADLYRQDRSYAEAAEIYRNLISESELADEATFQLAQTLAWQRQYAESIELLRSLLARDPTDRSIRLELARVLGWAGRTDESVAEYRKLIEK